jgi:hypothetical protein
MSTNSSQLFDCEHCGSWVKVRNVCPKCGQAHSKEWIEQNTKNANIGDFIALIILVPIAVMMLKDIFR